MLSSNLILIFPAALAFAAVMDMLTMTIPNRISVVLVATFVLIAPFSGLSAEAIMTNVACGAVMLVAGIWMFSAGWLGGGDAKLLAASSLWIGLPHLLHFLALTGICGSVLLTLIVLYRGYPAGALPLPAWALKLHHSQTGLPYGLAIGAAGLLVFPYSPIFAALAL